jgi:hypothetical protein
MRRDTTPEIVPEIEVSPTRKRPTRKGTMLTPRKMMNLQGKEPEKKKEMIDLYYDK